MFKRIIHLFYIFIIFSMLLAPLVPSLAYAQGPQLTDEQRDLSADFDGDGLPNVVEEAGWYTDNGGPYYTDPRDPDSDDDGLLDGEEKLFNRNPEYDRYPGIFVEYQDAFLTKEYYPWQKFGSRYIALPSWHKDVVVVRRGTTFSVGGPADGTIRIDKSIPSLTTLTPVRNNCTGQWDVAIPELATVGIYTITIEDGTWSKSLELDVIFQLPTDKSDAFVGAFVYNDDPDNPRDETAIHYNEDLHNIRYDNSDPGYEWIPDGETINKGYAWHFDTKQYKYYIFTEHVMPAINGQTNTWDAANALGARADAYTCTQWPQYYSNSWCVLNPYRCSGNYRNECTTVSALLTAFNRSAGIPARPVFTDWATASFDHATEIWTQQGAGDYDWYVMRGYVRYEGSYCNEDEFQHAGGYVALTTTEDWDRYDSGYSIYAINENWPDSESHGINNWWADNEDEVRLASWLYDKTAQTGQIIRKDWFETRLVDYWEWPAEPTVIGAPPNDWPPTTTLRLPSSPTTVDVNADIQFGNVLRDYGRDLNGDGRYDQLVFDIETKVQRTGDYWFRGMLQGRLTESIGKLHLTPGRHTIQLAFDGSDIFLSKVSGPYLLDGLWVTNVDDPGPADFAENQLDFVEPDYKSSPYRYNQFGILGAALSGDYKYVPVDTDGDKYADALTVNVGLDIEKHGEYTVQGILFNGQGDMLSQAKWTGIGSQAVLQFENLRGTSGPYSLQYVIVQNQDGQTTDRAWTKKPYLLGDISELNAKPLLLGAEALTQSDARFLVATGGYTDTAVDTDGNGKFDRLDISVDVTVEAGEGGQAYWLEGWLVDPNNNLVAYTTSISQVLAEGNHSLTLPFDGRIIGEHGVDGPYTLVAMRAISGTYNVVAEVGIAYTTSVYSAAQFEGPATGHAAYIFQDDMENGGGNWNGQSFWQLNTNQSHSPTHSWEASASGVQSGALLTIPELLDLTRYDDPVMKFYSCYNMETAGDAGSVEASTNGVDWITLDSYTNGETPGWSLEYLDLSQFSQSPNLQLRFNANSQSNLLWRIDDVSIAGWPAITATFTYAPAPVVINTDITFEASSSITSPLPITYTWNFGDGTVITRTNTPTVTHQFSAGIDYTVQLTVANAADQAYATRIVGAGVPLDSLSFDYTPGIPAEIGTSITFTADYSPISATVPITYVWDFGDGTVIITTTPTQSHSYSAGGNYVVELKAFNKYSALLRDSILEVKEGVSSVSFNSAPVAPMEDDLVTFTSAYLRNTASQPITYTWNFGDGSVPVITTSHIVAHTFDLPGNYNVQVVADNGYGTAAVYSQSTHIDGRPLDDASFVFAEDAASLGATGVFTASYSPSGATQPVTYTWNFGDGSALAKTASAAITHTFSNSGTFTVWMTATNGYGTFVYSRTVIVPFDDDGDGLSNYDEINIYHTDPNNPDTDNDGLNDGDEVNIHHTNPNNSDSDGDGLNDGDEVNVYHTDPNDPDTDNDGMPDGWEAINSLDPLVDDAALDPDNDGLSNLEEYGYSTNPQYNDTDFDGMPDGWEVQYGLNPVADDDTGDLDGDGLININEYLSGTYPNDPDSDDDLVYDSYEVGSDPNNPANTDGDALIDALDPDDDNDGIPTVSEAPDPNGDGNPADARDTDNDSLPDYLDPDDDGDGIPTANEDPNGDGDPTNDDSDNDGTPDYLDPDDDGDGIPTANEDPDGDGDPTNDDNDGDGIPDYLDPDDDNDGIPTVDEDHNGNGDPTDDDDDGDGLPDYLDDDNAPRAFNDSYTVDAEGILVVTTFGVLHNDIDVDGDVLTATQPVGSVSFPSVGNLVLNANGSFTYTHTGNSAPTTDTFSYIAQDSHNPSRASNVATVTIIIEKTNFEIFLPIVMKQ